LLATLTNRAEPTYKSGNAVQTSGATSLITAAGLAHADVIDFTSGAWSGSDGLQTFSSGGVTLSATASVPILGTSTPAELTFNGSSCGNAGVGLACAGDGIGINRTNPIFVGDQNDEVNQLEILSVLFAAARDITGVDFLNVFTRQGLIPTERMEIRANGGSWVTLMPTAAAAGGYFSSGYSASGVTSLDIRAAGGLGNALSEGSLARISYVPTPATAALVALGLAGFAFSRKQKAKQA
jgi:hypothetical protein